MPAAKISLLPDVLDLALYAGDGVSIKLTVTDTADSPLPVDGEVTAQIRKSRGDVEPMAVFTTNLVDGADGDVFISLTGEQTAALITDKPVFKGVWDVQWRKVDAEPVTIVQGKVECYADVTR